MVNLKAYKVLTVAEEGVIRVPEVAVKLGLKSSTLHKYLRILEKERLVEKIDTNTYRVTELGMSFVNSLLKARETSVSRYIVTDLGSNQVIPLSFGNYLQLYVIVKYDILPREILEEHFKRGYISMWIKNAIGDIYLYDLIEKGLIRSIDDLLNYIEKILSVLASFSEYR